MGKRFTITIALLIAGITGAAMASQVHCESDRGVGFCAFGDRNPVVDWSPGMVEAPWAHAYVYGVGNGALNAGVVVGPVGYEWWGTPGWFVPVE